ncbi:MAG: type II 3-dehydroquinate dehydratase [Actinobacteria bacterium]|uniref:3-dehydroquinate dehydratase n=1 Tax=freshwater metagenome TaxID=449393 RepID=A0A6J6F325_9ZZZZ|nr:type II 3-dehydroquinate dehydratase [Actinomycetota bacterium]
MRRILVLNGPNLSRLGSREPDVYGSVSWDELVSELESMSSSTTSIDVRQTDSESEMISWLHEAIDESCDVVLNPAAFTHYSYAIRDAVAMVSQAELSVIEVHISNPHAREEFRHNSVIAGVSRGVIAGFGVESYRLALVALGVK